MRVFYFLVRNSNKGTNRKSNYFPSTNQMHCSAVNQPIESVHVHKYWLKLEDVANKAIISQFHNTPDPRIVATESGFPIKVDYETLKELCNGDCKSGLLCY